MHAHQAHETMRVLLTVATVALMPCSIAANEATCAISEGYDFTGRATAN